MEVSMQTVDSDYRLSAGRHSSPDEGRCAMEWVSYLAGDVITEADWRLFVTLVRFDEVYHLHFRLNWRRVVEYPVLWDYTRELYQWPGVADTVAMAQIKRHYYTTHDELNPKRIIPVGPGYDWSEAHGRDR